MYPIRLSLLQIHCKSLGADLTTVDNEDEQAFIASLLADRGT